MREMKKAGFALCVGMVLFILTGFGPKRGATVSGGGDTEAFARHVAMLRSGKPQQKAAAAYWLGQQRSAAAGAVDSLLEFLGDATEVDAKQYRQRPLEKMTLGEEVAAAHGAPLDLVVYLDGKGLAFLPDDHAGLARRVVNVRAPGLALRAPE